MKTAVITGASSGLGREFVRQFYSVFPEIERVWLIARRTDRLQELAEQLKEKGISTLTLPLDLCDTMSFTAYQEHLVEEQPEIALLVNNAGCGYLGNIGEIDTVSQTRMIDLNLRALTAITNLSVPYMEAGSRILNVSSIASFCPTPRMTVYSATKAYVSAYTIGAAEDRCSLAGDGQELEIGFNVRYLAEALRVIPSEEVTLELTNGLSPIVLTPVDEKEDFAYMVLPVRIKNG